MRSCDIESVLDDMSAGSFDLSGSDRPAFSKCSVIVEVVAFG